MFSNIGIPYGSRMPVAAVKEKLMVFRCNGCDKDGDGQRDADADVDLVSPTNRVAIPTHFYKIILHVRPSGFIDTISLILPHLDQAVGSTNAFLKIDGSELAEYMIDHGVGVTSEAIYELKRIDSDYFSEE